MDQESEEESGGGFLPKLLKKNQVVNEGIKKFHFRRLPC
jgi:hypothetical protein